MVLYHAWHVQTRSTQTYGSYSEHSIPEQKDYEMLH